MASAGPPPRAPKPRISRLLHQQVSSTSETASVSSDEHLLSQDSPTRSRRV